MCGHLGWDRDGRILIMVSSGAVNKNHGPSVRTEAFFFIFSSSLREGCFHMDFYDFVLSIYWQNFILSTSKTKVETIACKEE